MLGRSVFQPADFTGLRSAFLRITMSFRTVSLKMSIRLTSPGCRLPLPITTILKKALICRTSCHSGSGRISPPFPIRGRQPYCRSLGSTRRYSSSCSMHAYPRLPGRKRYISFWMCRWNSCPRRQAAALCVVWPIAYALRQVLGFVTYAKGRRARRDFTLCSWRRRPASKRPQHREGLFV